MATIELTEANYNQIMEENDIVIIDFWAEWCAPCKQFAPIFEEASEMHPEVAFLKVNTDVEQGLARNFGIQSIPTSAILRDNIVVFQQAGVIPEDALADLMRQVKELDMDMVRAEVEKQKAEQK
jgi:thioredoxin 1